MFQSYKYALIKNHKITS